MSECNIVDRISAFDGYRQEFLLHRFDELFALKLLIFSHNTMINAYEWAIGHC